METRHGTRPLRSTRRRLFWRVLLAGILGLSAFGIAQPRRAQRAVAPPPPPDMIRMVAVQPVAGDPRAFRIVARMSRLDGGPVGDAFEATADLRNPETGQPLLRRQCGFTLRRTTDARSMDLILTDRLQAVPPRPLKAEVWIQNRWQPPKEQFRWELWRLSRGWLPQPRPQTSPAPPLTCPVILPAAGVERKARDPESFPRPQAVRSLLWKAPSGPRLVLRG